MAGLAWGQVNAVTLLKSHGNGSGDRKGSGRQKKRMKLGQGSRAENRFCVRHEQALRGGQGMPTIGTPGAARLAAEAELRAWQGRRPSCRTIGKGRQWRRGQSGNGASGTSMGDPTNFVPCPAAASSCNDRLIETSSAPKPAARSGRCTPA